jgi:hypothetical protein
MDSRQFVVMTKQYAVDEVVKEVVGALKAPRLPADLQIAHNHVEPSISKWINDHSLVERQRSEWFNQLTEENRKMVRAILEDCAERAVASFFTLLDGVGGATRAYLKLWPSIQRIREVF